jgi:TetR/AcrR family transcriptional regulator, mexJK operon transcriptional repressor
MSSEKTDCQIGPRLMARRLAFLEAAATAFLEKGYANTTLDDIIARSGGSRQTLYSLFGGKQGLFEAILVERTSRIFAVFHAEDLLDRPPHEMLTEIGIRFLETILKPDALGTYKLMVAESVQMKELVERFWETGPGRARALLAGYFEQQTLRGRLRLPDPEAAANQFFGMLMGSWHIRCLLGLRETPDAEEIGSYVRASVDCFLNGCGAKKDEPV